MKGEHCMSRESEKTGRRIGAVGGAIAGAKFGAGIGIAMGPLGAIAGTVPVPLQVQSLVHLQEIRSHMNSTVMIRFQKIVGKGEYYCNHVAFGLDIKYIQKRKIKTS